MEGSDNEVNGFGCVTKGDRVVVGLKSFLASLNVRNFDCLKEYYNLFLKLKLIIPSVLPRHNAHLQLNFCAGLARGLRCMWPDPWCPPECRILD